jgi:hypothetical protein
MRAMRRFPWVLLFACLPARAQVLHEKVAVGNLRCAGGVCWAERGKQKPGEAPPGVSAGTLPEEATTTRLPAAIEQDGQVFVAPGGGPQPEAGEQVYAPEERVAAPGAAGPTRRETVRPDRETGPEPPGKRLYHEVFNPALFPFKRMSAFDLVRGQPCASSEPGCEEHSFEVSDSTRRRMPVVGVDRDSTRDAFWGTIVVDFEPGKWVPIPSVAPDTRILAYSAEPRLDVTFARDGADNLYVSAFSGGRHRLTWLSDAASSYFGGELPREARLADEPATLVRPMPPGLRKDAQALLERLHIEVAPDRPLEDVLDPLVEYFRSFETGALPATSGSTYRDLVAAQKGSCRHRSFAFAVTALAAGIPTRYVENELHVFVEVYVPKMGWRRINLGGAAVDDELAGAKGKTLHAPRGGDPFPRPTAYLKNVTPPPKGFATRQKATAESAHDSSSAEPSGPGSAPHVDLDALVGTDAAELAKPAQKVRARTAITVELGDATAIRGDPVDIRGAVSAEGAAAGGLPVELYLDGPGGAVRIGETTSGADGKFHATLEVPRDLPLGEHRLVARTPGDERRGPSSTRRK